MNQAILAKLQRVEHEPDKTQNGEFYEGIAHLKQ
jgi:hypothetical protein